MSEFGKYINVPSRKGVFIPDITVEMFRNASLEGVEDLLASGEMEDISLPSAQPERKQGKWIERNPQNSDKCRLIECDQCGFSHIVGFNVPYEHWIENRNFCERCGADMREVDDERPD